jgi:hypothetical protein
MFHSAGRVDAEPRRPRGALATRRMIEELVT